MFGKPWTLKAQLGYEEGSVPTHPNYISLEVADETSLKPYLCILTQAPHLQELKLSEIGDMGGINEVLRSVPELVRLDFDCCELEQFPPEIAQLKHLERFCLTWNECPMDEVFDSLATLPKLKVLRFFQAGIAYEKPDFLPPAFARCNNLEEIDFSQWYNLLTLPEEIGLFHNLRSLEIANVDYFLGHSALFQSLPESLCDLPKLEKLDVYGCDNLTKLPTSFQKLQHLTWIDTLDSGIHELDFSEEQFKQIRTLHMNRQEMEYGRFTGLKELSIENDWDSPLDLSGLAGMESLTTLKVFHGTLLSTDFLTTLPHLRELRLKCKFDSLPELKPTVEIMLG